MEAICSPETSVDFHRITWLYILEDWTLQRIFSRVEGWRILLKKEKLTLKVGSLLITVFGCYIWRWNVKKRRPARCSTSGLRKSHTNLVLCTSITGILQIEKSCWQYNEIKIEFCSYWSQRKYIIVNTYKRSYSTFLPRMWREQFLRNVGTYLPNYMTSHLRQQ
jgi:hypothetical protein